MIVVTAGILIRGKQVLIARRCPEDTMGGLWEFPGGKVERGETPDMCLARELKEELDVQATPLELFDAKISAGGRVLILFYLCSFEGEPRAVECADVRMVAPEELKNFPFTPADMFVAQNVAKHMNEKGKNR